MFVHFKPVEYDDLREQFVKDKEAGLDVSHYGHTPAVPVTGGADASTLTASEAEAKLNLHKASYSKDKGGHEHDQHDEETLKRHMDNIDREREQKTEKTVEIKKMFLEAKEKAPLGGDNVENPDGRTALHEAASNGEYEEVVRLLGNQDTDMLNARDENGWQAIHEATRSGSLEIVK